MEPQSEQPRAGCPSCGSARATPIVYGLIDYETFRRDPSFVPGGCCVEPEDRRCDACGTRYCSPAAEATW